MTVPKHNRVVLMALLGLPLLLSACATAPGDEGARSGSPAAHPAGAAKEPEAASAKLVLPDVDLTSDLLYRFLLGEVAVQRGHPHIAAQTYIELARETRDPRVARRAAQIAYETHQIDESIEAFELWVELDPGSRPARQLLIAMLLNTGRLEEAHPWLSRFIESEPDHAGAIFQQLGILLARNQDKQASLKLVRDLAQAHPKLPEAHFAVAQVAAAADNQDDALAEVRQALSLRPDWRDAVMFEVQLLQSRPDEAVAALKQFVSANPHDDDTRLVYARMLLERKQYKESRDQFQHLLSAHPDNADLAFTVALLSMQLGDMERAEKDLQLALKNGKKDQDTVEYYLGQLSETKKDLEDAIRHYAKVRGGEYLYPARLRQAYLMAQAGKLDGARDLLHQVHAKDQQQQVQVVLLEAEMLRDARRYQESYRVLEQARRKFPDDPDLLYETAMMADKLGKPDLMEKLLRKLISLQPNNANAYNALGYSLLDRNVRIAEGMQLVEKAYGLAPNDASIIDSMGWGHYRQGQLDKSLEFLNRAYKANPDPEIAAHLGEVLWVHGNKDEARKVWAAALKGHPDSEALRAVMKRFVK